MYYLVLTGVLSSTGQAFEAYEDSASMNVMPVRIVDREGATPSDTSTPRSGT